MDETVIITPTQDDIDRTRGFRVSRWTHPVAKAAGGHNNYECLDCQYSSLFLDRIQKHVDGGDHPWSYPSGKKPAVADGGEPTY